VVSLRPITDANRKAVEALEVSSAQQRFVSNVADSLREANAEPDGRAIHWAVYVGETPVGSQTGDIVFDNEVLLRLELN
jgi:hypothetical protein